MSLQTPSSARVVLAVARKELRESFRDRQTALYAIVLPIVLYPAIFWCMIQGWLFVEGRKERTGVVVALAGRDGVDPPPGLAEALAQSALDPLDEQPLDALDVLPFEPARNARQARERFEARLALREAELDPSAPDALLWLEDAPPASERGDHGTHGPGQAERAPGSRLYFEGTRSRSQIARERVEERLPAFAEALRATALDAAGKRPADLQAFVDDPPVNLARESDMVAYVLSFALPILLVVMAVMGAFFPAVDLTAGERERRTAETTLLLPVPRGAVHQGKILAVCATAVLATSLNLLALGLSAGHLLGMLEAGAAVASELPFSAFLAVAPLAVLFAFFVSAVLTGVASFARTFKEGQALLGPVQMVFILPAMAGAIPGLELDLRLACVPVVNVVLSFKALLQGRMLPLEYALTALSLLVMAAAAIAISVRLLSREALVASAERGSGRKRRRARLARGGQAS